MIKFAQLAFFLKDKRDLDKARDFLREEGLVPPIPRKGLFYNDKLVWEDEGGVGRYRVDFLSGKQTKIAFRYWGLLMTPEIEREDPMYKTILGVAEILPTGTEFTGFDSKARDVTQLR